MAISLWLWFSAMGRMGDPYATDTLKDLMVAAGGSRDVSLRDMDLLMSCGKSFRPLSCLLLFAPRGCLPGANNGQAGIITDGNYGNAQVIEFQPERLLAHLRNDEVVVVAGFQGLLLKES